VLLTLFYNLKTGQNTVLRGSVAEEFARYTLSQRMPILILRPSVALKYLENASIKGRYVDFLKKNQQTMDFLGIYPFFSEGKQYTTVEETVCRFFYEKEGLTRYIIKDNQITQLRGFIIEVKSRTTTNTWAPFEFSLSPNQEEMLNQSKGFALEIILCGVTFSSDWLLTIVFCDGKQKILPEEFFIIDQYKQDEN
jgi:hypothetical protein